MKQIDVTVEISTKDRYETTLPLAILSVAQQTYKPKKLIIFDDGEQKDLRLNPVYNSLFGLLYSKGIDIEVIFGRRRGQVHNHQAAIELSQTEWIWRVDDDDAPEADVLERMIAHVADDVGAISGLILTPGDVQPLTDWASGKIEHIFSRPNVQWFRFDKPMEVDHFNNSFLFRKSAAKHGYCLELSPVGHREETMFTYEIKRSGYRLIVEPKAVIWHLRNPSGGIRSYESEFLWEHDERVFTRKMQEWGILANSSKLVVLDCGLGDHFAVKMMLPELKMRYKDDLTLAVCYPEVFADDGVKMISIADAEKVEKDMNRHNVYKWMMDNGWTKNIVDAYRRFLL